MGSLTITADDTVLDQAREYAARRKTSLDTLARDWLDKIATKPVRGDFDDIFSLMDKTQGKSGEQRENTLWFEKLKAAIGKAQGNSNGWKWNREDIYRERLGY